MEPMEYPYIIIDLQNISAGIDIILSTGSGRKPVETLADPDSFSRNYSSWGRDVLLAASDNVARWKSYLK